MREAIYDLARCPASTAERLGARLLAGTGAMDPRAEGTDGLPFQAQVDGAVRILEQPEGVHTDKLSLAAAACLRAGPSAGMLICAALQADATCPDQCIAQADR